MIWDDYWTIDTSTGIHMPSPPDMETIYEAESPANTRHGAVVSKTGAGGSEGHCVGNIGKGNNNYLQFNDINVSATGNHTIRIYYPNSDNNYRTASISLNDQTAIDYKFPPTDIIRYPQNTYNMYKIKLNRRQ